LRSWSYFSRGTSPFVACGDPVLIQPSWPALSLLADKTLAQDPVMQAVSCSKSWRSYICCVEGCLAGKTRRSARVRDRFTLPFRDGCREAEARDLVQLVGLLILTSLLSLSSSGLRLLSARFRTEAPHVLQVLWLNKMMSLVTLLGPLPGARHDVPQRSRRTPLEHLPRSGGVGHKDGRVTGPTRTHPLPAT
jgi:hypothetical protein